MVDSGVGGNSLTAKSFYCSVVLLRASLGWHDLCRGLKSVKGVIGFQKKRWWHVC